MSQSNRVFDDLGRLMNEAAGLADGVRREVETVVKSQAQRLVVDMELVKLHLADELRAAPWRLFADESITRGGCRAETSFGDIDATLQTRWRRVAASLGRDAPLGDAP